MGGNSCEFFKVYLSQQSSKQLGLPPAFVHQLGGKVPNNCTIKDPSGKIWRVGLEVANAGLVVANGWQEFASHHSLVDGDFLTFNYNGYSQFRVKIYSINGLQKRKAPDECASARPVKQERREEVDAPSRSLPTRSRPTKLRPDRGHNEMRNLRVPPRRFSTTPGGRSTRAKSKSMANLTSAVRTGQQGEKAPSSSVPTRPWPARLRPRNLKVPSPGGETTRANSKSKVNHTSHIKKEIQPGDEAPSSSLPVRPRPSGLRPNRAYEMRNLEVPRSGGESTGARAPSSSLPIRPRPPGLRPNRAYTMTNTQTPLNRFSTIPGGESTGARALSSSLPIRPRPPGLRPSRAYTMRNTQTPPLNRFSTSPGGARSEPKVNPTSKPEDTANKESATKHDECRSANLLVSDPPKNPHFTSRITLSSKHNLYVSRSKVAAFNTELEKKVTLITEDGKRWKVETVRRGKKRDILLRAGWRQFVTDNNLLYGDWCVFEMVPHGAKRISELLVRMQRSGNRMPSSTEKPQVVPMVILKLEE